MKICTLIMLGALLSAATNSHARETTAPDILLFTGDDMGAYLGCYGDKFVKTPNIDKIASEGVRFDNAWVTQASCSPSRSSIITSLYPHQNGQLGLAHLGFQMSAAWDSIPTLLRKAGYFTGVIGKLHVKPDSAVPFDVYIPKDGADSKNPKMYAREVPEFLKKTGKKPFFLNVSFKDPHRPFFSQVDGVPENPLKPQNVDPLPFVGLELDNVPEVVKETADYYNGIMRVDMGVGMVMDILKNAGRLDNTIIIVIGDHGAPFTRAKISAYNPGMRIPFIVKWPGVSKPGTNSKALVSTLDILPTALDAAGAPIPTELMGKSLHESVSEPANESMRDFMFGEFTAHLPSDYFPRRTVRNKGYQLILNLQPGRENPTRDVDGSADWKAVMEDNLATSRTRTAYERYAHPPQYELFDLINDPDNFINLAGLPQYSDVESSLTHALQTWRETTHDPLLKEGEIQRLGMEIEQIKKANRQTNKKKNGTSRKQHQATVGSEE